MATLEFLFGTFCCCTRRGAVLIVALGLEWGALIEAAVTFDSEEVVGERAVGLSSDEVTR